MLKEIKYPGFNKDIVSFGMVKDIVIERTSVEITLQINSDHEKNISLLREEIIRHLNNNGLIEVNILV